MYQSTTKSAINNSVETTRFLFCQHISIPEEWKYTQYKIRQQ